MNLGKRTMKAAIKFVKTDEKQARKIIKKKRDEFGVKGSLLSTNTKLDKIADGYTSTGHSLFPAKGAGVGNLCPKATPECEAACIGVTSGFNKFPAQKEAKIRNTKWLAGDTFTYFMQLYIELRNFSKKCKKRKVKGCVRLNVYSDIVWEKVAPELFTEFPDIQFYDYTKIDARLKSLDVDNYDVTLSYSGYNLRECEDYLKSGGKVAVVFHNELPFTWLGYKVYNGDQHDYTFLHPSGSILGLSAKGELKGDNENVFLGDNVIGSYKGYGNDIRLSVLNV